MASPHCRVRVRLSASGDFPHGQLDIVDPHDEAVFGVIAGNEGPVDGKAQGIETQGSGDAPQEGGGNGSERGS